MDEKQAIFNLTDAYREELLSRYLEMKFVQLPEDARHYKCNLCDRLLFINYIASCGHVYCPTCKKVLEDELNKKCPIPIEGKYVSKFCNESVDIKNWWRDYNSESKIVYIKSVCLHSGLIKCHRIYPMFRILNHVNKECKYISKPRFSMPPLIPEVSIRNSTVFVWPIKIMFVSNSKRLNFVSFWKVNDFSLSASVELKLKVGVISLIFHNLTSPGIEAVMSPAPRVTYTFKKKQNLNLDSMSEDEGCVLSDKGSPPPNTSSGDVVKISEKRFNERLVIGTKEYETNFNPKVALKNFDYKIEVKIDFSCSSLVTKSMDNQENDFKIENYVTFPNKNKSKVHLDFYSEIGNQSGELVAETNYDEMIADDEWLANDHDRSQYFFTHKNGYLIRADFFPGKINVTAVSGPNDDRLPKNPCFLVKTSFYNSHAERFENFFTKVMWELECQIVFPSNMENSKYFRMKSCTVYLQVKHLE